MINLLASHAEQKALSRPHDTIRVHRVHCEATNYSAVGESDESNQVLHFIEVVVEVDQVKRVILIHQFALVREAAHIFVQTFNDKAYIITCDDVRAVEKLCPVVGILPFGKKSEDFAIKIF